MPKDQGKKPRGLTYNRRRASPRAATRSTSPTKSRIMPTRAGLRAKLQRPSRVDTQTMLVVVAYVSQAPNDK